MNLLKKIHRNERGSATIEFLGILPLVFIALAVIVQFVIGANGVLMAHSAVNESASVYSVTENHDKAELGANKIVNSAGNYLSMNDVSLNHPDNSKDFTAKVTVDISLMFLPDQILGYTIPSIPYSTQASGRVIK